MADPARNEGLGTRLLQMLEPVDATHSDRPEVVGQIMTRHVRVAGEDRLLADLVAVFSDDGHHHIPIMPASSGSPA